MRAVFQRVKEASVEVSGAEIARIGRGALVLLGVEAGDSERDAAYVADKCCNLRVFDDREGRLNLSVMDMGGSILLVSQFTILGDCRKGRRPSFVKAASQEEGKRLYELTAGLINARGVGVQTGRFQADMDVHLINEGPVTILIDSRRFF